MMMPLHDDPFLLPLIDPQLTDPDAEGNHLTLDVLREMQEALATPDPDLFLTSEGRSMLHNAWLLTQVRLKRWALPDRFTPIQHSQQFSTWMRDLLRTGRMDPQRPLPRYKDLAESWQITEDQVARVILRLRRARLLPAKPKRSDAGKISLTPRDLVVLWWIAHQRAIRYDQLQRLLSRESEWATEDPQRLSMTRTTQTIKRWVKAGLVVYRHVLVGEPGWIWLTPKGMRLVELEYRATAPAPGTLAHLYAINEVRLHLEDEARTRRVALTWRSERAMQHALEVMKQAGRRQDHMPDALLDFAGETFELEVERTRKNQEYLEKLMRGVYGFSNRALRYYVAPSARKVVLAAFNKLHPSQMGRAFVEIFDLVTYQPLTERKGPSAQRQIAN